MLDDKLTEDPAESADSTRVFHVAFGIASGALPSQRIELEIASGETVCVIGATGAPPSLMRLSGQESGEADTTTLFDGGGARPLDFGKPKPRALRRLRGGGVAPLLRAPLAGLKQGAPVGRQLADMLAARGNLPRPEISKRLLDLLGREKVAEPERFLKRFPEVLPTEVLHRVLIAVAFSDAPRLLLADNPSRALNLSSLPDFVARIDRLKRDTGMASLVFAGDLGLAAQLADRVLVVERGRKIEEGPVAEIFDNPGEDHTRALMAARRGPGDMAGKSAPEPVQLQGQPEPIPVAAGQLEGETPLLEVRNLVVRNPVRGGFLARRRSAGNAVEDISFNLQRGETLALLGEPGCGMELVGRAILGDQTPHSGRIGFDGRELVKMRAGRLRKARAEMALIAGDPFEVLHPKKKLGEQMSTARGGFGGNARSRGRERAAELFQRADLPRELLDRRPGDLTRGECQRALIARAVASRPRLILAENILSTLDPIEQARALNLLIELQAEFRIAILFITRDPAAAERVSHQTAIMYMGRVVELGPRQAMFEDPHHPYTKLLLASVPLPDPGRKISVPDPNLYRVYPVGHFPGPTDFIEVSPGHVVMRKN